MFGLVVFIVVFGAVMLWRVNEIKEVNKSWARAAANLGLSLQPATFFAEPEMTGFVEDTAVLVQAYSTGGKNKSYFTRYRVLHQPVGPPVTLRKQGTFSFMGKLVGRRDVEVGDPFFDDRVVVDAAASDSIRRFLTPTRRAAVLDLLSVWPSGEFTHESIEISSRGRERNPNRIHSTVFRLIDTAAAMGSDSLDHILEQQQQGGLGHAAAELHTLNESRSNVFTEILEAEALVEMGQHEQAAMVFDQLGARLPDDPSISQWQDLSHLPPPPALPDPPAPPDPPAAPLQPGAVPERVAAPAPVNLDQQVVVDDLFAANRMSWQIVEYFETTYQNAAIEWSGTVTQFHSYRHDSDFKEGPGIKATVLLGQAGESDFISNEVHAMVQLPEGAPIERGSSVRFTGLLTHVDRFSRKVYVERAQLVS